MRYMDYEKFRKEYEKYMDWESPKDTFKLDSPYLKTGSADIFDFNEYKKSDSVNNPSHYTRGSQEAIDTIEEAIQDAPFVEVGFLQGQVLKYLLRLWLKDNPVQDAEKARWYLNRLIEKLQSAR